MSHLNQEIGGNFHILSLCGYVMVVVAGRGGGIEEIRVIKRSCCKVSSIILRLDLLERPLPNYLTSPIKRCAFLAP